ncbi:MAG: OmpA family protein [Myxococcaceae bacterium]
MKLTWSAVAIGLFALSANAEQSTFNIHVEPGAGPTLNTKDWASGVLLNFDTTFFDLGPVAPEINLYGFSAANSATFNQGAAFGAGIGARVRLLNDEKGYLFNPGGPNGNALGNLWADAHLNYTHGALGIGFDVGLGYEFSIIDGLQVGPFARLNWLGRDQLLTFGLTFSVGFPSNVPPEADPDGDGIKGAADKCPTEAGTKENDGCPDKDKDGDGLVDRLDKCPDQAGPKENNGCPDTDSDHDGIVDRLDKCPDKPEDKDGYQDDDGCPDPDNDQDGVPDGEDKCRDVKGLKENNGCPDTDKDGDGIVDRLDKCPDEPETYNGVDDEDGCPEKEAPVVVTHEQIVIKDTIQFAFNDSKILPKSDPLLDKIAEVLKKFPNVKKVSVEGHTDERGDDKFNQTLSEKRAAAVVEALTKRGIEAGRLTSKGFGKSKPIVNPAKAEADHEKNRRVEFIIVEQG